MKIISYLIFFIIVFSLIFVKIRIYKNVGKKINIDIFFMGISFLRFDVDEFYNKFIKEKSIQDLSKSIKAIEDYIDFYELKRVIKTFNIENVFLKLYLPSDSLILNFSGGMLEIIINFFVNHYFGQVKKETYEINNSETVDFSFSITIKATILHFISSFLTIRKKQRRKKVVNKRIVRDIAKEYSRDY